MSFKVIGKPLIETGFDTKPLSSILNFSSSVSAEKSIFLRNRGNGLEFWSQVMCVRPPSGKSPSGLGGCTDGGSVYIPILGITTEAYYVQKR